MEITASGKAKKNPWMLSKKGMVRETQKKKADTATKKAKPRKNRKPTKMRSKGVDDYFELNGPSREEGRRSAESPPPTPNHRTKKKPHPGREGYCTGDRPAAITTVSLNGEKNLDKWEKRNHPRTSGTANLRSARYSKRGFERGLKKPGGRKTWVNTLGYEVKSDTKRQTKRKKQKKKKRSRRTVKNAWLLKI